MPYAYKPYSGKPIIYVGENEPFELHLLKIDLLKKDEITNMLDNLQIKPPPFHGIKNINIKKVQAYFNLILRMDKTEIDPNMYVLKAIAMCLTN